MYEYVEKLDRISRRPYLVEEKEVDYPTAKSMNCPEKIIYMMERAYAIGDLAQEKVFMLTMNAKCDVTGVFLIGKGGESSSICDIREILTKALLCGAGRIVLIHNHPSGDPSMSEVDISFTRRLAVAGSIVGIVVLDSIVVGTYSHYSAREENPDLLNVKEESWLDA